MAAGGLCMRNGGRGRQSGAGQGQRRVKESELNVFLVTQ